jgi:hypothetical protein
MRRNKNRAETTLSSAEHPVDPAADEPGRVLALVPPVPEDENVRADVPGSAWFEFVCIECGYHALFAGTVVESCSRCSTYAWVRSSTRSPRTTSSQQVASIGPAQDTLPGG